jgi:hypothetical protein
VVDAVCVANRDVAHAGDIDPGDRSVVVMEEHVRTSLGMEERTHEGACESGVRYQDYTLLTLVLTGHTLELFSNP